MDLIFRAGSSPIISDICGQNGQKSRSTVQIQIDEHLRHKIMLRGGDGDLKIATYDGQDFGDGGSQEPNDTLGEWGIPYQQRTSRPLITSPRFHTRRPRPNALRSWKPKRSKPKNMMRSKMMSVTRLTRMFSLVMCRLTTTQACAPGIHLARI